MILHFLKKLLKLFLYFTCPICTESLPKWRRFRIKGGCCHAYCAGCIARYVKIAAVEQNKHDVKCPSPRCNRLLDPLSCRAILSAATFARWCDVLCEDLLVRMRQRAAYCPYRDCSEPLLNECSVHTTFAECPRCRRLLCFRCRVPWHDGYACNGRWKSREDLMFEKMVEMKGWRRCPKCRRYIELTVGCTTMHCRCHQTFCYICGETRNQPFHKCNEARIQDFFYDAFD